MTSEMLNSLFEARDERPMSVSELNSGIRSALERKFPSVWVEGEITNFLAAASGHWYFSLSDGDSVIKAACFKGQNYRIRFKPGNGDLVRVRGRVSVYERRGEYQVIVESLEPAGAGALAAAFEQIKAKLQAEGLFDASLKRPLPQYPKRVGIVTSPRGAAVHDILTVLRRRARSVSAVLVPTLVQGDEAPEQICAAIEFVNEYSSNAAEGDKIDVLIVGRGGGSAEDLWAFNDERVARAIRASGIPVISAVGHEVDFSISDLVADLRAATPSAAAEIVAESEDVIAEKIKTLKGRLAGVLDRKIYRARERLASARASGALQQVPQMIRRLSTDLLWLAERNERSLSERISSDRQRLASLVHRLSPLRLAARVEKRKNRLESLVSRNRQAARDLTAEARKKFTAADVSLHALSPLSVLSRGYAIVRDGDGRILREAAALSKGDRVQVRLLKGSFGSEVTDVEPED